MDLLSLLPRLSPCTNLQDLVSPVSRRVVHSHVRLCHHCKLPVWGWHSHESLQMGRHRLLWSLAPGLFRHSLPGLHHLLSGQNYDQSQTHLKRVFPPGLSRYCLFRYCQLLSGQVYSPTATQRPIPPGFLRHCLFGLHHALGGGNQVKHPLRVLLQLPSLQLSKHCLLELLHGPVRT